jgi:type III secretion protein V
VFLALAAFLVMLARKLQAQAGGAKGGHEGEPDALKGLQREGAKARKGDIQAIEDKASAFTAPLAVTMSPALAASLRPDLLNGAFERERLGLQEQLGLPFPGIRLWTRASHADNEYELLLHDGPPGTGQVAIGPKPDGEPSNEEVIAKHAVQSLHEQAHQFLGIQEVQWVLERVGAEYPGLVAEMQKVVTVQRIAEVLRRLLEEQLPIRNMRAICESLINWGPKEKDALMLTEYVRGDLGRWLSHRATQGSGSLSAVLLEPAVEKMIRDAIKPTPAGNYLALAPDAVGAIARRVKELAGITPRAGIAVVTSMDIRRYVRRIVESESKWLAVYSYQELGAQVRVEPLGRVAL